MASPKDASPPAEGAAALVSAGAADDPAGCVSSAPSAGEFAVADRALSTEPIGGSPTQPFAVAGEELDGAETVSLVRAAAAAHGIEEDLLVSDFEFLTKALINEGCRPVGVSSLASPSGHTSAGESAGLAGAAGGTAGTLQFVGCAAHPELQGEYHSTEEGRDDLEHVYTTYKQVVAGANVLISIERSQLGS